MAKVGMSGAGGDDEIVVIELLVAGDDFLLGEVEVDDFFEQDFKVAIGAKDPANGRGDFSGDRPAVAT